MAFSPSADTTEIKLTYLLMVIKWVSVKRHVGTNTETPNGATGRYFILEMQHWAIFLSGYC